MKLKNLSVNELAREIITILCTGLQIPASTVIIYNIKIMVPKIKTSTTQSFMLLKKQSSGSLNFIDLDNSTIS